MTKEEKARHRRELADLTESYQDRYGWGEYDDSPSRHWIWVIFLGVLGGVLAAVLWWN